MERKHDKESGFFIFAAAIILFYNLALILIYLSWKQGGSAVSYWRYSTHLAPLAIVAVIPFIKKAIALFENKNTKIIFLVLFITLPFLLVTEIRYDLEERKIFIRETVKEITGLLGDKAKLAILTAGDNKLDDYLSYRGIILFHKRDVTISYSPLELTRNQIMQDKSYTYILTSCQDDKVTLLKRYNSGWQLEKTWNTVPGLCNKS